MYTIQQQICQNSQITNTQASAMRFNISYHKNYFTRRINSNIELIADWYYLDYS